VIRRVSISRTFVWRSIPLILKFSILAPIEVSALTMFGFCFPESCPNLPIPTLPVGSELVSCPITGPRAGGRPKPAPRLMTSLSRVGRRAPDPFCGALVCC